MVACRVIKASIIARPELLAMLMIDATSGAFIASLNGVIDSARLACMRVAMLVSCAMTMEIPIELPMLRTSVRIAVRRCADAGQGCEGYGAQRHEYQAEAEALHELDDDDRSATSLVGETDIR